MSVPNEPDFAVLKLVNPGSPAEAVVVCGIDNVSINETANTTDRFRRDCEKPGLPPARKVKVTGTQWDITGSGVFNMDEIVRLKGALGVSREWEVDLGKHDGTDTGVIIGTYTGPAVLTSNNKSFGDEGTGEVTLAGENELVWTPVAP